MRAPPIREAKLGRRRGGGSDVLRVPRRVPARGDGAAAAGVPAPVPRGVHRSLAGRALDVPALPLGHHGRRPATGCVELFFCVAVCI